MGKKGELGKALTKSRTKKKNIDPERVDVYRVDEEDKPSKHMTSHTDDKTDLEELMEMAVLDDRTFEAEKQNVVIITSTAMTTRSTPTRGEIEKERTQQWNVLTIPRRPAWTPETTPEELNKMEREAFVEWRRKLAQIEEENKFTITPFEKNLEIWRQLWRVVEKSDLVCQILDARNPLLFRCPDLEQYVKEVDRKKMLLILNKADLLTKRQRFLWAKYFKSSGLDYVFFSASIVNEDATKEDTENAQLRSIRILSREELLHHFSLLCPAPIDPNKSSVMVGLVGYPNVGKSSTINALVAAKKVSVAPTPGKTKHFQTIMLSDSMTLCDCPGLVFPTVVGTKADMICDGLLSIDQMRDFVSPAKLVCERIPRALLEHKYGVVLPQILNSEQQDQKPVAEDLLNAYAFVRGFMTQSGLPDQSRAARIILKDYVQGRILYCHPPPGISDEEFTRKRPKTQGTQNDIAQEDKTPTVKKPTYTEKFKPSPYDEEYDQYLHRQVGVAAHTTGKFAKFNHTRVVGSPYTPIPAAQLAKDPKLLAVLAQNTPKSEVLTTRKSFKIL